MSSITLTPAFGRDYKSKREAVEAFREGDDFILNQFGSPCDGKPVNREQLMEVGVKAVNLRYKRQTMLAVVPVR